ncbi:CLUMA_CG012663, isoform A [Clunio marinus]|uniref:CLUMA_CG012663, isoform A n=1 Tax=Clunio marinus TaxID=568069 RepID=A0A1J1IJY9_9DIPT|nr:CLUMA_CG012663, isoform A [Clunio marinus]
METSTFSLLLKTSKLCYAQEEEEEETKDSDETETAIEVEENETTENGMPGDYPDGTSEEEEGAAAVTEQPENTEDDDVANMVLDEEMEKAALKIQSKFRGHKTRIGVKRNDSQSGTTKIADESKQEKDSTKDVDEEIANMVLDDEMAKAALKIQSTFRGHKTRKDIKKNENSDKKNNEEEEKSEENENLKNEEATQSSSTEKSAKQLQDEEDIANLVMDTEMEQTALKIQSAFRVKSRKKLQKENESSTRDNSDDEEHDDKEVKKQLNSNEDPFKQQQMNEDFESVGEKSSEEKNSDSFIMANYCYPVEESYYIERYDSSDYEPLETSNYEINLMQGGGTFPELSGESSELLTSNSNEEKNPERNNSLDTISARDVYETSFTKQELTNLIYDEKITENFYFNGKKNSAEELYYSLKKNELETQRNHSHNKQLNIEMQSSFDEKADDFNEDSLPGKTFNDNIENKSDEATAEKYDEDDDDVVIGARVRPTTMKRLQYGMSMDERFLGSTLSQNYSENSQKDVYPNDRFNPVLEERIRSQYFLEKLHEKSTSDEDNKCNSEDLFDGTGDEDQFDDFYNSENLRKKIMASSFSITDSDYYDPVNIQSIIEDDKIRTALETIHSTDSESTIASAATKIPYEDRKKMKHNNNSTSQSMQYSSIGNSAIDKSLEDFIQSQELRIDRFDEDDEEYDSPLLREPQSTDIWTNDPTIYTDSEKRIVVGIKMKQKNSSLTVDERRRTLHREDAIQRNSTREDEDSSKSSDAPGKKLVDKKDAIIEGVVAPFATQDLVINTENSVLTLDIPSKPKPANQVPVKAYKMKRQHTMPVQIQSNVIRVVPKHLRKRIKSADGESKRTSLK